MTVNSHRHPLSNAAPHGCLGCLGSQNPRAGIGAKNSYARISRSVTNPSIFYSEPYYSKLSSPGTYKHSYRFELILSQNSYIILLASWKVALDRIFLVTAVQIRSNSHAPHVKVRLPSPVILQSRPDYSWDTRAARTICAP